MKSKPTERQVRAAVAQRVSDLRAENARLREALEGILENEVDCTCGSGCDGNCWYAIGRAALRKGDAK